MKDLWNYLLGHPTPRTPRWRWIHVLVLAAIALTATATYWHYGYRASVVVNDDLLSEKKNSDQDIFIQFARFVAGEREIDVLPRQHMPGYAVLMAPSIHMKESRVDYFHRAKYVPIFWSIVTLVAMAGALRRWWSWTASLIFSLGAAFLLYIHRSGYYQPELAFFALFLGCLIAAARLLDRPSWTQGIVTGGLFALTYYFKSSMLPALALLGACWGLRLIRSAWLGFRNTEKSRSEVWRTLGREAGIGLTVPAVFLLLLSPYLYSSWKTFHDPFYSAHSKYFVWCEDHDEAAALRAMRVGKRPLSDTIAEAESPGGLRIESLSEIYRKDYDKYAQWPKKWREEGIPTMARYFKRHTLAEIGADLREDSSRVWWRLNRDYGPLIDLWHASLIAMAAAVAFTFRRALELARAHWLPSLFFIGALTGYLLLFTFYAKLGMGPRLFLNLALPFLFAPWFVTWRLLKDRVSTVRGLPVSWMKVVHLAFAVVIAIGTRHIIRGEHASKNKQGDLWRVIGGQ